MSQSYTKSYRAAFSEVPESESACEQIVRDIVAATEGVTLESMSTRSSGDGDRHDITVEFEVSLDSAQSTGRTVAGQLMKHAQNISMCDMIAEQGANPAHSE